MCWQLGGALGCSSVKHCLPVHVSERLVCGLHCHRGTDKSAARVRACVLASTPYTHVDEQRRRPNAITMSVIADSSHAAKRDRADNKSTKSGVAEN